MERHARSRRRRATPTLAALARSRVPAGFLGAWHRLVADRDVPPLPRRRGQKAPVPLRDLLLALTIQVLNEAGMLSEHFAQLFDEPGRQLLGGPPRSAAVGDLRICCSACSGRRPRGGRGSVCQGCRRSCKSYMKPICRGSDPGASVLALLGRLPAFILLRSAMCRGCGAQTLIDHSAYLRVNGARCRWRAPNGHTEGDVAEGRVIEGGTPPSVARSAESGIGAHGSR